MTRLTAAPILLFFCISRLTAITSAEETNLKEQTIHYEIDFENVRWYQKIALVLLGLNWKEISIKTAFTKDEIGAGKIFSVIAWPDNSETENPDESEIMFRLANSTNTNSFIYFLKYTKFREEEIPQLLSLYNYLYDDNPEEINFHTANLFDKENGSMFCKFSKRKTDEENLINIETFNSAGAVNGEAEIAMKIFPEKHLEKIKAKLKIGIEIILTKKPR